MNITTHVLYRAQLKIRNYRQLHKPVLMWFATQLPVSYFPEYQWRKVNNTQVFSWGNKSSLFPDGWLRFTFNLNIWSFNFAGVLITLIDTFFLTYSIVCHWPCSFFCRTHTLSVLPVVTLWSLIKKTFISAR